MTKQRKVIVYKSNKWEMNSKTGKYHKVIDGDGIFYGWGLSFTEYETGIGNYSIAIVEMEDGTVKGVDIECIKFKDGFMK